MLFSILVLIFLLPTILDTINEIVMPDKTLWVGQQITENAFEFTKEIKDKDRIEEFESLYEEIIFTTGEWNEKTYADIVLQINHKKGIITHQLRIWIYGDEAIALRPVLIEDNIGKLSKLQLENLKAIISWDE